MCRAFLTNIICTNLSVSKLNHTTFPRYTHTRDYLMLQREVAQICSLIPLSFPLLGMEVLSISEEIGQKLPMWVIFPRLVNKTISFSNLIEGSVGGCKRILIRQSIKTVFLLSHKTNCLKSVLCSLYLALNFFFLAHWRGLAHNIE